MPTAIRKGIRALIRTTGAPDNPPAGQRALIPKTDGWYDRDSSGAETNLNTSGLALTVVEVDCGTIARTDFAANVAAVGVTTATKVTAFQAGVAATSRQADEAEMEPFQVVGVPTTDQIRFTLAALPGARLQGKVKFFYAIGS